jgi:hypothetical protein
MPSSATFNVVGYDTIELSLDRVTGSGHVYPRLCFDFSVRLHQSPSRPPNTPPGPPEAVIRHLYVDVSSGTELLGRGELRNPVNPITIHADEGLTVEVPMSRAAIHHIDETARGQDVILHLVLRPFLSRRWQAPVGEEPEEWRESPAPGSPPMEVSIARSDWVTKVLAEIQTERYVWMELPIPPLPGGERWRAALEHLTRAENRFQEGSDAEVLRHCYDALDALSPGAPKAIVPAAPNQEKRAKVDDALARFRTYLQEGRHLQKPTGLYDADRRDSEFALSMTKVWLTYLARLAPDEV